MPATRLRYNYDEDALSEGNQLAAAARGWIYELDWHDYKDSRGNPILRDRFRERPLDPTALK